MFRLDLVERRCLVRCVPIHDKRVLVAHQRGDHGCGDALAIAREPHLFVCLGFDGNTVGVYPQDGCQCLNHRIDVWTHLGLFQYQCAINVVHQPAFQVEHVDHFR